MTNSYEPSLDYIHSFDDPYLRAIRDHGKQTWGIEMVGELLNVLGDPHLSIPTIHIAGTKGKGSTAAFITQGLIESGLKVGLYSSPHLEHWSERIQVNREPINSEQLEKIIADVKLSAERFPGLSAFELTTALALWHFAREGCDIAVIEVGLGGRLDATSVVEPIVSVITNISYDHMNLLGNTLEEIAGEKAAIIKLGVPVVSAPQVAEAMGVIEQQVALNKSRLTVAFQGVRVEVTEQTWQGTTLTVDDGMETKAYEIGLAGGFQVENAIVALEALKIVQAAGITVTDEGIAKGLKEVEWIGRIEILQEAPLLIIDSAHTPYAMQQLSKSLKSLAEGQRIDFVFGCMADKDITGMVEALLPLADSLTLTQVDHARAASTKLLEELLNEATVLMDYPPRVRAISSVSEAVETILTESKADSIICVTGSLAVAGAARKAIKQRQQERDLREDRERS